MSQLDGQISVDEGYREAVAGSSTSGSSRVAERAAGAWSDNLGQWGSEEWELPGLGDEGPRCSEWQASAVCETCGSIDFTTHQCGRRGCPECWGVWAKESAVRAATRLQSFRYTQPENHRRQAAHSVVSPPEGSVMNERQFYKYKSRAADIAEEKGFRGFAVIPHPYRLTDDAKRLYRAVDPEYGIWAWWRNDMDENRDLIKWSPHFHIIGMTTPDMDAAADSDDYVYNFIRSFGRFDGVRDEDSHREVYGAFRYLLSHTGWPEDSNRQAVTWHGCLANSVFVEDATEEWQYQKPSEGVRSALEREIEDAVGVTTDDEENGSGGADIDDEHDAGECPSEDCDGRLIDVFEIRRFLRYSDPPDDVAHTMRVVYDWRMGEISLPPGLKRPSSEEHAAEAVEWLKENY